ncbi:MAG: excinuclease ABC subunit UvrA [Planctomycetes bacterium]|nr:excinuclease ABC subunit UvrA [Planctomycetota bacterium]
MSREPPPPAIRIRGARQHNLAGIDVDIPLGGLTVVTGVSGSGKSSLALDTLYAEGQRRYVETFSAYARQFLERMDRPHVDAVEGVPAAIAIDPAVTVRTSRSTVGTMTELTDFVKVIYARLGVLYCHRCGKLVREDTPAAAATRVLEQFPPGETALIAFPIPVPAGAERTLAAALRRDGYRRLLVGDEAQSLGESLEPGEAWVIQDRLKLDPDRRSRLVEAIEAAFRRGSGRARAHLSGHPPLAFDRALACADCGIAYRRLPPAAFSFNSPLGACPACRGFGRTLGLDDDLVVPNPALSLRAHAIKPYESRRGRAYQRLLLERAPHEGIPVDVPWSALTAAQRRKVFRGTGSFPGVEDLFAALEAKSYKMHVRVFIARFRGYHRCEACGGTRLKPEALAFRLGGLDIASFYALPAARALEAAASWRALVPDPVAELVVDEIVSRLRYLDEVGLGYLPLDRASRTLSGGEVERVHLTAALGSALVNTLYVLDEPSIGLHPRDVGRLVRILQGLKERGNTVVVVEHDPDVIRHADHVIDLGPGPGAAGGRLVYQGPPAGLLAHAGSATGRHLAAKRVLAPGNGRPPVRIEAPPLVVRGVTARNLQDIDVSIPIGRITCLTGVSGSGKSTLLEEVLYRGLRRARGEPGPRPGAFRTLAGHEQFAAVHLVDQTPLTRTPRSNPLTYLKAFDPIRRRFAAAPAAAERGLEAGHFSTNVAGGRCERCKGDGVEKVEMQFLPDAYVTCPDCGGNRYQPEVLEVALDGRTILDVLQLTAAEAMEVFAAERAVTRALAPLVDAGLGYLRLGQAINTLSGGEAQRLKLARFLGGRAPGPSIFLLDEPTTGLHADDIERLLQALERLREAGHTIVVIEHHLGVIARADHVIDLGPEGGDGGGEIVAAGSPAEVARHLRSITGRHLRAHLDGRPLLEGRDAAAPPRALAPRDVMQLVGLREHNLKDLTLRIPHNRLIVVTGVSGSGKSTLAFDILFAEGQRAYIESISTYARRYIPALPRPQADRVTGIPPAVAIEQRTARGGGTSTVATATEIYHYLRLLYARAGTPHCTACGVAMSRTDPSEAAHRLVRRFAGRRITLLAPVVRRRRGYHKEVMERAQRAGCVAARIDGRMRALDPLPALDLHREHDIDVVVAELVVGPRVTAALRAALDRAFTLGRGAARVLAGATEAPLSRDLACPECGRTGADPDPRLFSFNHSLGACPECSGLGTSPAFAEALLVPDPRRTLRGRALEVLHGGIFSREDARSFLKRAARAVGVSLRIPYGDLPRPARRILIHGEKGVFEGLIPYLMWVRDTAARPAVDEYLGRFTSEEPCPACGGTRLKPEALAVRIDGLSIAELAAQPVARVRRRLKRVKLAPRARALAQNLLAELARRLGFLERVGLGYLTLDRRAATLSGGESQRIRLAAQLGAELTGVLYVLDEPTIGLHPADHAKLLGVLEELRDRGNTVVVVEHDPATIRAADHIIDLGPGGGQMGGRVMAEGTVARVRRTADSPTGRFLRRRRRTPMRTDSALAAAGGAVLRLTGAREHNLKDVELAVPLGALTAVTGVSGSGKSTLVRETLLRAVAQRLHRSPTPPGAHTAVEGWQALRRAAEVDQSPIGRTPASVPATYVGIMDEIRALFALTPEARARGYSRARFSFNRREGSCPACGGLGRIREEMAFLPDVTVACEACEGRRYNAATLEARFKGRSIADVLAMTVEEAEDFFADHPRIHPFLEAMERLGLGYLTLGQPSPTLSGGEAQRIKLVEELGKKNGGPALLVLDEPTTGLHPEDVDRLLAFFRSLTERGHTLVVIEHNLEAIAAADHVVDLGPAGGEAGGRIVAQGPPGQLARRPPRASATARYLAQRLERGQPA